MIAAGVLEIRSAHGSQKYLSAQELSVSRLVRAQKTVAGAGAMYSAIADLPVVKTAKRMGG